MSREEASQVAAGYAQPVRKTLNIAVIQGAFGY
jgi:hypothetical protein